MVVLARSPGCPSRHEPARSQGFPIPSDNFLNKLARVCDSVGKSPALRGLDAAFPSHFVMRLQERSWTRARLRVRQQSEARTGAAGPEGPVLP